MAHAPLEVELKLAVAARDLDDLRAHPLLLAYAEQAPQVQQLHTRYFDTPTRQLAQHGMALRLRRAGRQWWQALKTGDSEAAMSQRGEWEWPLAEGHLSFALLRDTPLARVADLDALRHTLREVFATRFRRETWLLRLSDGTQLALCIDTGQVRAGRHAEPICEVELELRSGDAGALLGFARELSDVITLVPLARSKAARGHALAEHGPAVPPPARLRPAAPAPDALVAHALGTWLQQGSAALAANGALLDQSDVEYVHQARVAVRLLRSLLRLWRDAIEPHAVRHALAALRRDLRALGQVLGAARDADVFVTDSLPRLQRAADAGHVAAWPLLAQRADARRVAARAAAAAYVASPAFGSLLIDLERCAYALKRLAGERLATAAPPRLDALQRALVKAAHGLAGHDAQALHRLRIAAKQLRYGSAPCAALFAPGPSQLHAQVLAALQTQLGRLNDDTVALQWLQALNAPDDLSEWARLRARRRVHKLLPEVAADVVRLQLIEPPWHAPRSTTITLNPTQSLIHQ